VSTCPIEPCYFRNAARPSSPRPLRILTCAYKIDRTDPFSFVSTRRVQLTDIDLYHPPPPLFAYRALTLHADAGPYNIASGAILGIGAGFLWTAQGSLMLAYPTENNKGKFIAIFWSIFNLGGVVGAAVSLGQNYDSSVSAAHDFSWDFFWGAVG
jgi:hypothetical protein